MNKTPQKSKLRFPLINMELLRKNKHFFFLAMGILMALILASIDYFTDDKFKGSFLGGILVEAHGMLLDIILFGVLLTIYEKFTEKHNDIERLKEEIDDYRRWNESEAKYRIVGCIKRLNKKGVTQIDLRGCFLKEARLNGVNLEGAYLLKTNLEGANLNGANLNGAYLNGANLEGANLWHANLQRVRLWHANLQRVRLWGANFEGAELNGADLRGADLRGADLRGAKLHGADLEGANLQGAKLEGAKIDNLELLEVINAQSKKIYIANFNENEHCYTIE